MCGPLDPSTQPSATSVPPKATLRNCATVDAIAAVATLTVYHRAGTRTLSQVVIPYHSLVSREREGETERDTTRERQTDSQRGRYDGMKEGAK